MLIGFAGIIGGHESSLKQSLSLSETISLGPFAEAKIFSRLLVNQVCEVWQSQRVNLKFSSQNLAKPQVVHLLVEPVVQLKILWFDGKSSILINE